MMKFAYDGFEQREGLRQTFFSGLAQGQPDQRFCFTVELALLASNRVGLQEVPHLCSQILGIAEQGDAASLGGFGKYRISEQDLVSFTAERRAQAALREKRKNFHRKPAPKARAAEHS